MNIEQAMRSIIENYGIGILDSPDRFQSMIMDYAKGYDREIKLFNICCHQGILDFAKEIIATEDVKKIEIIVKKAKNRLEDNAFMTEDNAINGINMILRGIGVKYELVVEPTIKYKPQFNENSKRISMKQREQSDCKTQILLFNNKIKIDENLFKDLRREAQNGDKNAMVSLGDFYKDGIIVEKNWRMAEYYYRKAAELESKEAKYKYIQLMNEHRV